MKIIYGDIYRITINKESNEDIFTVKNPINHCDSEYIDVEKHGENQLSYCESKNMPKNAKPLGPKVVITLIDETGKLEYLSDCLERLLS